MNAYLDGLKEEKELSFRGQQIRDFYASCLNKPERKKEEVEFSNKILAEIKALQTRDQFLLYASKSIRSGKLIWFEVSNEPLLSNPKQWRILVFGDWFSLPEKIYYQSESTTNDLVLLFAKFFEAFGFRDALNRAKRIVELETKLSNAMPTRAQKGLLWNTEKYWTQSIFIKKFPILARQIGIKRFPQNVPIHQYSERLYDLLEKTLANENVKLLKDFLLVRILFPVLNLSQSEWQTQFFEFKHKHFGRPLLGRPIQQECARLVENKMGRFLAAEMIKKFFSDFPREEFAEMVESLREALIQKISQNAWLSDLGRERAVQKIRALRMALLFPEKEDDWRFPPLGKLSAKHFLQNLNLLLQAEHQKVVLELKSPRSLNSWGGKVP